MASGRRPPLAAAAWAALLLATALAPAAAAGGKFREVAADWGLDFRHHHGGTGRYYQVETDGSGVALVDYDRDGDLDVFFVDSGSLPGYDSAGATPRSRLLRNEGGGAFADVTGASGIEVTTYGMGVVAGDVDGDGDPDLYVTGFGANHLFVNQGDGRFVEAGVDAGVADPRWSASAALGDADRDGDLDLYVANYLVYRLPTDADAVDGCADEDGTVGYCHPALLAAEADGYYRNGGDGRFADATAAAGLASEPGKGLGVVFRDFDDDGWPDLYVANDTTPNFLFLNRGNGTFRDDSFLSGTAFNEQTKAEAGMGIATGDVTGDGLLDIFVTNYALETNALYGSMGQGLFFEARFLKGVAEPSIPMLGFGTDFADVDHDGDLDLVIANGHVLDQIESIRPGLTYRQRNQLLLQDDDGRFVDAADSGFDPVRVSRGLATGDLDGDGDLEVVVNNSNDTAEVYENLTAGGDARWLQVDLESASANTRGVGARAVLRAGDLRQTREVAAGTSYLSHSSMTLHFGLGPAPAAALDLRWPDGSRQRYVDPADGRRLRLYDSPPAAAGGARR